MEENKETPVPTVKKEKGISRGQLQSFTVRVETSIKEKLDAVGGRTGSGKTSKVARQYLRLAELFALDNTRIEGWDGKDLMLVPVEIFRELIRWAAGNDEYTQIELGDVLGRYLKNLFYLYPRESTKEKMDLIKRLGWFIAKRDPSTGHALIPTNFAPELTVQAMIYQIACKKAMPPPPRRDTAEKQEKYDRRRREWQGSIQKDLMEIKKNLETEIGFDALSFE